MEELKEYTIPFKGLKVGTHHYEFKITSTFFEHFEYEDFERPEIDLSVKLDKKSTLLDIYSNRLKIIPAKKQLFEKETLNQECSH